MSQAARHKLRRSTSTGDVPVNATSSSDHRDGTWSDLETYVGELFLNTTDHRLFVNSGGTIQELPFIGQAYKASVTIATADVLTSNVTPVELVAGIAGKELKCIEASVHVKYNSITYTTNLNAAIIAAGASTSQLENTGVLGAGSDLISAFAPQEGGASANVITGAALQFITKGGNPAAGDSDIVIDFTYIIRDIA